MSDVAVTFLLVFAALTPLYIPVAVTLVDWLVTWRRRSRLTRAQAATSVVRAGHPDETRRRFSAIGGVQFAKNALDV